MFNQLKALWNEYQEYRQAARAQKAQDEIRRPGEEHTPLWVVRVHRQQEQDFRTGNGRRGH